MPFGRYIQDRNLYIGNFWGTVYDNYDNPIKNADEYFLELSENNNLVENFQYRLDINIQIKIWSELYIKRHVKDPIKHYYTYGFGGMYSNGVIHFSLPEQVLFMPDIPLDIDNKHYQLRWKYYD